MNNNWDIPKKLVIMQLENDSKPKNKGWKSFENWTLAGPSDQKKKVLFGKLPSELVEELAVMCPNYVNINGVLAEVLPGKEPSTLTVVYRDSEDRLEAGLNEKDILVDFKNNIERCVRWRPFFMCFKDAAKPITKVTKYPLFPVQDDQLVLTLGIQPEATGALDRFVSFFCPATPMDFDLIKALIATIAWSKGQGKRPMFLIAGEKDVDTSVSIGKSTLVDKIALLFESGAEIHPEVSVDKLTQNLMALAHKQVIKVDNVRTKEWSSTALERIITSPEIAGHKLYKGYVTCPNNFTFVVTINDPNLNEDLASRCVVIRLARPEGFVEGWEDNIDTFIESSRIDVMRDLGAILTSPAEKRQPGASYSRFPAWQDAVLNKININLGIHIKKEIESIKLNGDFNDFNAYVKGTVSRYSYSHVGSTELIGTDNFKIFVTSQIMTTFYQEWLGIKVEGSGRGALGKKLKSLALQAGMEYTPDLRVNNQTHSGYWVNPEKLDGVCVGVLSRLKESSHVAFINKQYKSRV